MSREKTQELLMILENIQNSYDSSSPLYKFKRVFYNIVDAPVARPLDFPVDLWNEYFIPDSPLQPVILNRYQIEERKKIQDELVQKLLESKGGIEKKLQDLKFKRELVKNRLENVVNKFRCKTRKYVFTSEECRITNPEIIERESVGVVEKKEEVVEYLRKMRERLERFEKKVNEALHLSERKLAIGRQLDKSVI